MKTTTKKAQKIIADIDRYVMTMKLNTGRSPERVVISKQAALDIKWETGDRLRGISLVRHSD